MSELGVDRASTRATGAERSLERHLTALLGLLAEAKRTAAAHGSMPVASKLGEAELAVVQALRLVAR